MYYFATNYTIHLLPFGAVSTQENFLLQFSTGTSFRRTSPSAARKLWRQAALPTPNRLDHWLAWNIEARVFPTLPHYQSSIVYHIPNCFASCHGLRQLLPALERVGKLMVFSKFPGAPWRKRSKERKKSPLCWCAMIRSERISGKVGAREDLRRSEKNFEKGLAIRFAPDTNYGRKIKPTRRWGKLFSWCCFWARELLSSPYSQLRRKVSE